MTHSILTPADSNRIAAAVGTAESHANGEIVTVITRVSDSYGDIALAWSAAIAGLALLAMTLAPGFYGNLADSALGLWTHRWTPHDVMELALCVASVKFAATWLVLQWRPLRLRLVPGPIKSARVRARAAMVFRLAAQGRTQGATGVVIYLSMAERRAEIVADTTISDALSPQVWGDAMHAMLDHFRADRVADGMVAGVEAVGAILAQHVPSANKPTNELPDGPIEV